MFMSVDGELSSIASPQSFEAKVLYNTTLPAANRSELSFGTYNYVIINT